MSELKLFEIKKNNSLTSTLNIESLPDKTLVEILSFLPFANLAKLRSVSKKFRRCAERALSRIELAKVHSCYDKSSVLAVALNHCRSLKELIITCDNDDGYSNMVTEILKKNPEIESLSTINADALYTLEQPLENLKALSIQIDSEVDLRPISWFCPNLQVLEVDLIGDQKEFLPFSEILATCEDLRSLSIWGFRIRTGDFKGGGGKLREIFFYCSQGDDRYVNELFGGFRGAKGQSDTLGGTRNESENSGNPSKRSKRMKASNIKRLRISGGKTTIKSVTVLAEVMPFLEELNICSTGVKTEDLVKLLRDNDGGGIFNPGETVTSVGSSTENSRKEENVKVCYRVFKNLRKLSIGWDKVEETKLLLKECRKGVDFGYQSCGTAVFKMSDQASGSQVLEYLKDVTNILELPKTARDECNESTGFAKEIALLKAENKALKSEVEIQKNQNARKSQFLETAQTNCHESRKRISEKDVEICSLKSELKAAFERLKKLEEKLKELSKKHTTTTSKQFPEESMNTEKTEKTIDTIDFSPIKNNGVKLVKTIDTDNFFENEISSSHKGLALKKGLFVRNQEKSVKFPAENTVHLVKAGSKDEYKIQRKVPNQTEENSRKNRKYDRSLSETKTVRDVYTVKIKKSHKDDSVIGAKMVHLEDRTRRKLIFNQKRKAQKAVLSKIKFGKNKKMLYNFKENDKNPLTIPLKSRKTPSNDSESNRNENRSKEKALSKNILRKKGPSRVNDFKTTYRKKWKTPINRNEKSKFSDTNQLSEAFLVLSDKNQPWQGRVESMDVVEKIIDKNGKVFKDQLCILKNVLIIQVFDLRSVVVKRVCKLLTFLGKRTPEAMSAFFGLYMNALFSRVYNSIKAIREPCAECIREMAKGNKDTAMIKDFLTYSSDPHSEVRKLCLEMVRFCLDLSIAQGKSLGKYSDRVASVIKRKVADANKEVRKEAKELFMTYKRKWPKRGKELFDSLTFAAKKMIGPQYDLLNK